MSGADEVRLSLTLMLNKEKTKVLFAAVDSSFADILLSFLTLPLGRIQRLLVNHYGDKSPTIGCLNTLYSGLQNLDSVHFWAEAGKQMLLNPRSSLEDECCKLKLNVCDAQPTKYFTCECTDPCVSLYQEGAVCSCGDLINKVIDVRDMASKSNGEVLTNSKASFLISDDLTIVPNASASVIESLNSLGIKDTDGDGAEAADPKIVTVGFKEIMDLLEGSLCSQTPLTDLFLRERSHQRGSATATAQTVMSLPQIKKEQSCNARFMKN